MDQNPLGSQFKSYELNAAINYYLLDPYQYAITKFDYANPKTVPGAVSTFDANNTLKNIPDPNGLIYKGIDIETLLPAYTTTKKSENDYTAGSYHRFEANDGYFNPLEGTDNTDLWYYGASELATKNNGESGAVLNVQEVNHIIFPEVQRGGLNSTNLAKYSWSNSTPFKNKESWEAQVFNENHPNGINNDQNCQFFNYNNYYSNDKNAVPVNKVYSFDSDYARKIGISSPTSGTMPYSAN
jgi:hypothetical protein